jgi:hypothetical protein
MCYSIAIAIRANICMSLIPKRLVGCIALVIAREDDDPSDLPELTLITEPIAVSVEMPRLAPEDRAMTEPAA